MKYITYSVLMTLALVFACQAPSPSPPVSSEAPTSPPVSASPATSDIAALPDWLQARIKLHQTQAVANPPISISQGLYQNKTVYYETSDCCDQFSSLYDENGSLICAPDGGLTGRGDGKCTDFEGKMLKLVWQDPRNR